MIEVAITGIGVVSPFGIGKDLFTSALREDSRVPLSHVPEFRGTELEAVEVGLIPDLDQVSKQLPRRLVRFMSQAALMGCLAGKEAADEAAVTNRYDPEAVGIYSATGLTAANLDGSIEMLRACVNSEGRFSENLFGKVGLALMNPVNAFKVLPNMPACILSILLGIKGPNLIFNPWEGQSAAAILDGYKAILEGEVDCALVGAADTAASPSTVVYLKQESLIGENEWPSSAGAYLVLETLEKAKADGRQVYGVLKKMDVENTAGEAFDPLALNIGRTFAAAPPLLLAAACLEIDKGRRMIGTRGISFTFLLHRDP